MGCFVFGTCYHSLLVCQKINDLTRPTAPAQSWPHFDGEV